MLSGMTEAYVELSQESAFSFGKGESEFYDSQKMKSKDEGGRMKDEIRAIQDE
jgi:hypothetical protein